MVVIVRNGIVVLLLSMESSSVMHVSTLCCASSVSSAVSLNVTELMKLIWNGYIMFFYVLLSVSSSAVGMSASQGFRCGWV